MAHCEKCDKTQQVGAASASLSSNPGCPVLGEAARARQRGDVRALRADGLRADGLTFVLTAIASRAAQGTRRWIFQDGQRRHRLALHLALRRPGGAVLATRGRHAAQPQLQASTRTSSCTRSSRT